MKAVVAELTTARYVATKSAQFLPGGYGRKAGWGRFGLITVRDLPPPNLPEGDGWVVVEPELCGICGSDLGIAKAKMSFVLSAYYPAESQVLGHEIVGRVARIGSGDHVTSATGETVAVGDRVVIDPVIACQQRGFDPCRACRGGHPGVCDRFVDGGVCNASAPTLGFLPNMGGGWAEEVVAHQSMLYPVGDVPAEIAVLAEPASIALHAALRWDRDGDRAVVIGPGTVGLLTVAALRRLHPDLDITVLGPPGADHHIGCDTAEQIGADRVLSADGTAVGALDRGSGGVLSPRMTKLGIARVGVDVVFDCVGTSDTIDLSAHLLGSGRTLVLVGTAGSQPMDWSLVWNRELTIRGTVNHGPETALDGATTFATVTSWMKEGGFPGASLLTHRYGIDSIGEALETALAGPAAGAIKVAVHP